MILQIGRKRRRNKIDGVKRYALRVMRRVIHNTYNTTRNTHNAILNTRNSKLVTQNSFTLIELIIVAAIIVALVGVSSPLFRTTFKDIELKDAAYNLSKLIKYGQQSAVIEEKRYRLLFNFEKGSYHLLTENEEAAKGELSAGGKPAPDWKKAGSRFGADFYLPEGIKFKADVDKITFLPSGRCDKISLYIIDQRSKIIVIKTNGRAGYVEVSEVKEAQ